MFAGKLDRKIRIERDSGSSRDSLGAPVEEWEKFRDVWANVVPMSGGEVFTAGKDTPGQVSKFFVRYFLGLNEKDRISYDGKAWDILYFREIGRQRGWEILAQVHKA